MSDVAILIEDMVRAGVCPSLIGRTAQMLSERNVTTVTDSNAFVTRTKNAERQARYRANKACKESDAENSNAFVTDSNVTTVTDSNAFVTPQKIEKEKEKRTKKEKENPPFPKENPLKGSKERFSPLEIQEAAESFNRLAESLGLPRCSKLTSKRKQALKARLADCGGLEGWEAALMKIRGSPFLHGKNDRGWKPSIDFLCQESSFIKLMEGFYDGSTEQNNHGTGGKQTKQQRANDALDRAEHEICRAIPRESTPVALPDSAKL